MLIINRLRELYPTAKCSLDFASDYELLIATRLSAQCTDARVNIVTRELFARYKTLADYASADLADVENIVRPCGFYHNKAAEIIAAAQKLLTDYGGRVPESFEDLLSIPGVGRKSANLLRAELFGHPAIIADTHCIRLSNRLGLCDSKNPEIVEKTLRGLIPEDEQTMFCHRLVSHGRAVCHAKNPQCEICGLRDICGWEM